jgi:hypothetical protein
MIVADVALTMGRRMVATVALVAVLGVGSTAWAQEAAGAEPAAQEAAPAQPPAPDPFSFNSEAAAIIWQIKGNMVADFEDVWAQVKAKLAMSEKPELQALGTSLRIYRAATPPTAQGQSYFFIADPVVPAVSYSLSPYLLFEAGLFTREEGEALFARINQAIDGLNAIPLVKVD